MQHAILKWVLSTRSGMCQPKLSQLGPDPAVATSQNKKKERLPRPPLIRRPQAMKAKRMLDGTPTPSTILSRLSCRRKPLIRATALLLCCRRFGGVTFVYLHDISAPHMAATQGLPTRLKQPSKAQANSAGRPCLARRPVRGLWWPRLSTLWSWLQAYDDSAVDRTTTYPNCEFIYQSAFPLMSVDHQSLPPKAHLIGNPSPATAPPSDNPYSIHLHL
jgi:hypothetical protein